ncbi:MAG: hypothetical protein U0S12_14410 [Fimbriimonadales bacterium]
MLRDVLFQNPEWLLAGCMVWVPVGIMVLMLIQAMVMGEVEVAAGFVGLFAALGLGVLGMKPPHPSLSPLIFAVATGTLFMLPVLRAAWNKNELAKIRLEAIESSYEALLQKPNNVGAQLKLAKALFEQGMAPQAVAIGDHALTGLDPRMYADDYRMVRLWKQHVLGSPRNLECLRCHGFCPPNSVLCPHCGHPFLLDYARGWLRSTGFAKMAAGWIGAVLLLVGVPAAASSLPPALALAAVPVMVAAAAFVLYRAFFRQVANA